jgi:F-type H+-transporting ATPase subunit epsilon
MSLLLEIVTPGKKSEHSEAFDHFVVEKIDHVVVPTQSGEIDILPGHIPLLSILNPGEVKFGQGAKTTSVAVSTGFVQVRGDKVSILTEGAIDVEKIDLTVAEKARRDAEAALEAARAQGEDPTIIEELETKARFAVVQTLIKKKF